MSPSVNPANKASRRSSSVEETGSRPHRCRFGPQMVLTNRLVAQSTNVRLGLHHRSENLDGIGCSELLFIAGLLRRHFSVARQKDDTIVRRYGISRAMDGPDRAAGALQARAPEMELIREAQAGSRVAFDALVRQYEQQVLRLALHLTGSEHDAEDIYQEAFLKAFRYIGNFRFECSFYTWIYRIVTNLCLDQLRRRKTRREDQAVVLDHSGDEIDMLSSVSDNRSFSNPAQGTGSQGAGRADSSRAQQAHSA